MLKICDVKRDKRAIATLCFGTVAIISDIYVAQPILPLLSTSFGVSHTVASLAVSLNILALSLALLVYGPVSDYAGRKPVMVTTGFLLVIPTLSIAFTHNFTIFLVLRTVQGLFVAGIAAIAMAYINEEFPSAIMGRMMGLYVSSMVAAGFLGRVLSGVLAGTFSWRITFIVFGILNLLGSWIMFYFLPASRHFKRSSGLLNAYGEMLKHFRNRRLAGAFIIAFTLFFTFTGAFTYITFYLSAPPFNLSTVSLGLIFTVYITGVLSPVAGSLSGRFGRRAVMGSGLMIAALGISLTMARSLAVIIAGLLFLCAGLFSTQPAAGSFVGDNAKTSKGSATSLYLFSYYIGGSAGAFLPGFLWNAYGWPGVLAACFMSIAIAFLSLATLCR
ncbi:MAG: MFS transporter [Nitrospirae bacterium]|nr:MFS transporter [Nitrospirota bacterium]